MTLHTPIEPATAGRQQARPQYRRIRASGDTSVPAALPGAPPRAVATLPEGAVYSPPDTILLVLNRRDRLTLATTIERLVNLLDMIDGDADLEPSLGAPERHPEPDWTRPRWEGAQTGWAKATGARDEEEPTLGAPERHPSPYGSWGHSRDLTGCQTAWAKGSKDRRQDDAEDVSEDEGACIQSQPHGEDFDREPALGWTAAIDQTLPDRHAGDRSGYDAEGDDEREFDPAEAGIGDTDGLAVLAECATGPLPGGKFIARRYDWSGDGLVEAATIWPVR